MSSSIRSQSQTRSQTRTSSLAPCHACCPDEVLQGLQEVGEESSRIRVRVRAGPCCDRKCIYPSIFADLRESGTFYSLLIADVLKNKQQKVAWRL